MTETLGLVTRNIVTLGSLVLTGVEPTTGTVFALESFDGWGSPGTTLSVTQSPRAHGGWSGDSYLTPRVLSFNGYAYNPDASALSYAADILISQAMLPAVKVDVNEVGRHRWCNARRSDEVGWTLNGLGTSAAWTVQMTADDPRKYGDKIQLSTHLPSKTGGMHWPMHWPMHWDGSTVSGIVSIYNPGTVPSPVVIRFDGPVAGPSATHVGSGKQMVLSSSYNVPDMSWLTVDMYRQTVLEADQASRNSYVNRYGWFSLDPGTNQIIFGASTNNPESLMTVTTYPAWL